MRPELVGMGVKILQAIANLLLVFGASLIFVFLIFLLSGSISGGVVDFLLPGLLFCLIASFVVLALQFAVNRKRVGCLFGMAGCALVAPFVSVVQGLAKAAALGLEIQVSPSVSIVGWWSGSLWPVLRGAESQGALTLGFDVLSIAMSLVLLSVALALSLRRKKSAHVDGA